MQHSLRHQARKAEANGSGPISEVLSKLVRMIVEVAEEARKRAPLVALVSELEEARSELAWVSEWERDEGRYKVRRGAVQGEISI